MVFGAARRPEFHTIPLLSLYQELGLMESPYSDWVTRGLGTGARLADAGNDGCSPCRMLTLGKIRD